MPKKANKSASPCGVVKRPRNWDKAISVAYLRATGDSQEAAANQAGICERTVTAWEASPWWPDAVAEAHKRWLNGCDAKARRALRRALDDPLNYAQTARWWADRRIPELEPPKVRNEVTGKDGAPLVPVIAEVEYVKGKKS